MMDANKPESKLSPVEKSIQVTLPLEAAFNLFTAGISSWWPLASHSVGEEDTLSCHIEEHQGGRIYEVNKDGSESTWGTVLAWEPPKRFMMSWHPGYESEKATEVEVLFESEGAGTRLVLIHRNWEMLGERAEKTRASYLTGWDLVLGRYLTEMEAVTAN